MCLRLNSGAACAGDEDDDEQECLYDLAPSFWKRDQLLLRPSYTMALNTLMSCKHFYGNH